MKKILQLALVIVTGLACCSVSAQESVNVFEKKKALELTAGYPSILYRSDIFGDEGYTDYFYPCVNISYVNSWRPRWELSTVANIHYSEYQDNQDQSGRQGRIGAVSLPGSCRNQVRKGEGIWPGGTQHISDFQFRHRRHRLQAVTQRPCPDGTLQRLAADELSHDGCRRDDGDLRRLERHYVLKECNQFSRFAVSRR